MSGVVASWKRAITLPVAVSSLQFEADPAVRSALRDVSIRALSVAEPGSENREARRGVRLGPASMFLMDGSAWVEPSGVWVSAGSGVEFTVAVDPPAPVQLFVRNGPVENAVSLESGSWREDLTLRPGEERLMSLPVDANRRTTPLRVQASRGFRPSDVDRNSDDRRLLGVWIETR